MAVLKGFIRVVLPIAIVAAGVASYQGLLGNAAEPSPPELTERAIPVRIATIHPAPRIPSLGLVGVVESRRVARVAVALQADVVDVKAVEGELVEAGTTLVLLDARHAQLALRQREAEVAETRARLQLETEGNRRDRESLLKERLLLDLANKELARVQDLVERRLGSQSRLDRALEQVAQRELAVISRQSAVRGHGSRFARIEAQLVRAESARDRAALELERTRVTSPFRGRIAEVFAAPGDRMRPGDPLLSMFDVSRLEVRAQIPRRHLADVEASMGNHGHFEMDGRLHDVTLDRLAGQVVPGRGGIDALFTIYGSGDDIRIGRTVELTLELGPQPDAVWIPFEALYGADRVFKVQEGRLAGVRVRRVGEAPGPNRESGLLVSSPDLADGDRMVVNQLSNAVEGLRVVAVSGESP